MKKQLLALILLFTIAISAKSQDNTLEDNKENSSAANQSSSEFLDLFTLGYNGASPKINLQTYNFKAYIGKTDLDFYLFNSVPTLIPGITDTSEQKRYVANDVLQQVGGLLNVALGKVAYFGYGDDPDLRYIKGAQMDVRIGGKLMETPFLREEVDSKFFPAFQASADLRYLIPLVEKTKSKDKKSVNLKEQMVGNLSFRVQGSLIRFFPKTDAIGARTDVYSRYFIAYEDNRVVYPQTTLFAGNAEMFFYITNKIYISAGYFFSNDPLIDNYPFFSVSYGHR